jgi:hypothetical protein
VRSELEQFANGPHLQAAFSCERLLEESDGVLSAIWMVDTVIFPEVETSTGVQDPVVNLTLFIACKAGRARGSYDRTVAKEQLPDEGSPRPSERHSQTILIDGADHGGITVIMPLAMSVDQEGAYWFRVVLDGRLVTRLPLRVVSNRAR